MIAAIRETWVLYAADPSSVGFALGVGFAIGFAFAGAVLVVAWFILEGLFEAAAIARRLWASRRTAKP